MKTKISEMLTLAAALSLILTINVINVESVRAEVSENYSIERVSHKVGILYNGYIVINDTINLSGTPPESFLIGFPQEYGASLVSCKAYNPSNLDQTFQVTLNVQLGDRNFYGVKVDLLGRSPQVLTVIFVLSNSLISRDAQNRSLYTVNFPAYPVLTKTASMCNVSITLPKGATYVNGTVEGLNYTKLELSALTYNPANITFMLSGDSICLFTVKEFKRVVSISGTGDIEVTESYYISNRADEKISSIAVVLPPNASNIRAEDEFGRKAGTPAKVEATTNRYKVSFLMPVDIGKFTRFAVKYKLPKEIYVKQDGLNFEIILPAFQDFDYYIEKASIIFAFPEGAEVAQLSCNNGLPTTLSQEGLVWKGVIYTQGASYLDAFNIKIAYKYNPLWLSFRPTLWIFTLAAFGTIVVAIIKKTQKPAAKPAELAVAAKAVELVSGDVESFINFYEEKRRILSEIETLEASLRRGRIPRHTYKVRKKTLETRLASVSRSLEDLKLKLIAASGRYADLMFQFERAEADIAEAEAKIRDADARYYRGELSLEAYRKIIEEYEQKRDDAEARISGILVRLREETH